ncbi:MAG: FKBP-type peptidyl-prolyl cis-trans isomerase [Pseudomonadota bacterium]
MQVANQKVTTIDYTLTDTSGEVIDQSTDGEFAYLHGHQNIIPGLENALEGKTAGDEVSVTIEPDQAYGERDDRLLQSVPMDIFPDANQVEVGSRFQAEGPDGQPMVLTVTDVGESEVQVDANHPLAGETLNFEVKVVDVRDAGEEELEHGHPHT